MPRLGDPKAAEDALAETFTTAFARLADFEERGKSLWPWLARIAANKATDQHRARARKNKALVGYEKLLAVNSPQPGDAEEALLRQLDAGRLEEQVAATLKQLNPRYRRTLELRFLQGRSRTEAAEALGVKVATFDVVLLRSLRAFRKLWLEGGAEEIGNGRRAQAER
jgi:RNA polymerase sigma-70 factor (ECF subfamily)